MSEAQDDLDVLSLLTHQHRDVDLLIESIEAGDHDAFADLADTLAAHATIEEEIFYPSAMRTETEELLRESVEEHLSIKRVLADMLELDTGSAEFAAKLAVLKEQLEHHAHEEEEEELFPKLRRLMTADERRAVGNECLVRFEELIAKHPANHVAAETDHAARLS